MTRVFEHRRVWRLHQDRFDAGAALLADAVAARAVPHLVVGIARGGVPLASALAAKLAAPLAIVTARHNPTDAVRAPGTDAVDAVEVDEGSIAAVPVSPGALVVVADDICGSATTLTAVTARLARRASPLAITTVTLCRNVGSARTPHLWLWDVADWVVFPWEAPVAGAEPLPPVTEVRRALR